MHKLGQRCVFYQLLERNHYPRCMEAYVLYRIANSQHRNPSARDKRMLAKGFQTVVPAIMLGYHAQAGGTAVHSVELGVGGEVSHL